MANIEVTDLFKVFGPHKQIGNALEQARNGKSQQDILDETGCMVAVNNVSFTVEGPEIFVIMGLSGSGKSTLLRCVNRLIEPTAGAVKVDGDNVLDLEEEGLLSMRKQKMAMVFQHFGLLSHKNVIENVGFGLELRKASEQEQEEKAREALELVGLSDYAENEVAELSGGMQQRVGLARALATDAEILLMDEAFSALDPLTRTRMQKELLDIQDKMPKTILFITHDLNEALALGDRIAILKSGVVVQVGGPEEIVRDPQDEYVEAFLQNVDRARVITAGTTATKDHPSVRPGDGVQKAVKAMDGADSDYVFVMDGEDIRGVVRYRDAVREADRENPDLSSILLDAPEPVRPDEHLVSVLARVSGSHAPLPVVDESGSLAGMVTKDAILAAIGGTEK
ncbi:MAG: glycine betaine/L-proline ABC transporter ATP-binding protein [Desulfatibacillaceae bacterium]